MIEILKKAYVKARIRGTEGIAAEPDFARMERAYHYLRRHSLMDLRSALTAALAWKYDRTILPPFSPIGAPNEKGYRYVERPLDIGLGKSDWSDKVLRLRKTGYTTRPHATNDDIYRGIVLRLRKDRYFAAYKDGSGGGYVVDCSRVYGTSTDAALAAERMSKGDAEREFAYHEQWDKAREWQDLHEELEKVTCSCQQAIDRRVELQQDMRKIESIYPDIADFAKENL